MNKIKINHQKGFTMIEIVIVIAIIAILSMFAFVSTKEQRQKATTAAKKSDLSIIFKAIQMYYLDQGTMPANVGGVWCTIGSGACLAELVTNGYIKSLPKSPDAANPYQYFDSTTGNYVLVATQMVPAESGPGKRAPKCASTTAMLYCLDMAK